MEYINALPDSVITKIIESLPLSNDLLSNNSLKAIKPLLMTAEKCITFVGSIRKFQFFQRFNDCKRNILFAENWSGVCNVLESFADIKSVEFIDCWFQDSQHTQRIGQLLSSVHEFHYYSSIGILSFNVYKDLLTMLNCTKDLKCLTLMFNNRYFSIDTKLIVCDHFWNSKFDAICCRNESLTKLRVNGAFEFTLREGKFPRLEKLSLKSHIETDFYGIMCSIVDNGSQSLKELSTPKISDTITLKLIDKCRSIKDLRITIGHEVDNWHTHLNFNNLEILQLITFENYNEQHLVPLLLNNPSLRVIHLNLTVTDDFANNLLIYCPNLETLILNFSRKMTNDSLTVLQQLPKLEQLQLFQCDGITDEAMSSFVKHCLTLRVLFAYGDKLGKKTRKAFLQKIELHPNEFLIARIADEWQEFYDIYSAKLLNYNINHFWNYYYNIDAFNSNDDYFAWKQIKFN